MRIPFSLFPLPSYLLPLIFPPSPEGRLPDTKPLMIILQQACSGGAKPLPYEVRVAEGDTSYAKRTSRRQALHGTKSCFVSTKSNALPYNLPINCFGIRLTTDH